VLLHGDDPTNLLNAAEVTLVGDPGSIPFRVERAEEAGHTRDGRARVLLWLAGLDDSAAAERWAGAVLQVAAAQLAELPAGEYYWREVIGCTARLPVIDEIWPTPGHDVLVVRSGGETVLIPATEDVLVRLDRDARELWIAPPDGLLAAEEDPN
jgi:16S rRNA processing protein RimM